MSSTNFAALLETFFTDRLIAQRRVSPHTVASYRDTFRLLLQFAQKELGKSPSKLAMTDLNTTLIGAFLDNLEKLVPIARAAEIFGSPRLGPSFAIRR
jgi:integrase/recombinase XerD